jgi:hypothetical protein
MRNFFGTVVDDFGDGTPDGPIPPHRDVPGTPAFNITTVPPGASYYLTTTHIYGFSPFPGVAGGGNSITATVEFTTTGDPDLVVIAGTLRTRALIVDALGTRQGEERARAVLTCQRLKA